MIEIDIGIVVHIVNEILIIIRTAIFGGIIDGRKAVIAVIVVVVS